MPLRLQLTGHRHLCVKGTDHVSKVRKECLVQGFSTDTKTALSLSLDAAYFVTALYLILKRNCMKASCKRHQ